MKRMIHIVGAMSPGGFENFIMNVYRNIDRDKVQFDFIVHAVKENNYHDEIREMGGRIFQVTRKSKNPIRNFLEIRNVIRDNHYEIVFRHTDNAFSVVDLLAAKYGGARKRIMHSHSTTTGKKMIHKFFRMWMRFITTDNFACSEEAGKWMFGKQTFTFVPNAIDTERFVYSPRKREELRTAWNNTNQHVYGHIGNFVYAKNHLRMIEICSEIAKYDEKAIFYFVGDGELKSDIQNKIIELNMEDKIHLLGVRSDVPDLLQIFDLFLFPSIYEGLPVSVIEAQDSGLVCLMSSAVTDDVILTPLVKKISLEKENKEWAQTAINLLMDNQTNRRSYNKEISDRKYDVKELAKWYETL